MIVRVCDWTRELSDSDVCPNESDYRDYRTCVLSCDECSDSAGSRANRTENRYFKGEYAEND